MKIALPKVLIHVGAATLALSQVACMFFLDTDELQEGRDAGAADATGTDPCEAVATAFCSRWFECGPFSAGLAYADEAACALGTARVCGSWIEAPDSAFTADAAAACETMLAGASCFDLFQEHPSRPCGLIPGPRPDGAVCGVNFQCQSGYCAHVGGTHCGQCTPLGNAGNSCSLNFECSTGLDCVAGQCRIMGAEGADCDRFDAPCHHTLACRSGRCGAPITAATCIDRCDELHGTICIAGEPNEPGICLEGSVTTAAKPCGLMEGVPPGLVFCEPGSNCQEVDPGSSVCLGVSTENQDCGIDFSGCKPPFDCIEDKCQLPDPAQCG